MEKRRLNISDISQIAGVSKATVSRVINNSPKVNPATKEKILQVIQKHNYQPSNVARSLSKNRTMTIGVILEDISNPFFMELAKGIESVLVKNGYTSFITSSNWIALKELELVRLLVGHRVDGIVIAPMNAESESINLLQSHEIPFVLLNCISNSSFSISSDNKRGGYIAAEHLIKTGHKQILALKGFEHQSADHRIEGFFEAADRYREQFDYEAKVIEHVNLLSDGFDITSNLLDEFNILGTRTGIFALNDFVAMGVIEGLLSKGINVPEAVSVIGYDDINFAGKFRVPLTTVYQPKFKQGEIAAEKLLELIQDPYQKNESLVFKPELLVRKSCGDVNNGDSQR